MTRSRNRRAGDGAAGSRRRRHRVLRGIGALVILGLTTTTLPIALLRIFPPPTTAFMWTSRSRDPATGRACEALHYAWRPWTRISGDLPRAVLVAEDQRFLDHRGFDAKAITDALDDYAAGAPMRGASTITQQVAKNLFLWPARSFVRKGLEAWLTVWIELLWPKRRILEVYVNVAQFGPCVFGAEAASQRYFGVPASQLSARQAALLAAVLPAPGRMRADDPGPFTQQRAREILAEMNRVGRGSYLRGLQGVGFRGPRGPGTRAPELEARRAAFDPRRGPRDRGPSAGPCPAREPA